MKLRFLCGAHRAELTRSPGKAITCWQDGFDTGQLLSEQKMWQEALPHLGCAFETSEIMIATAAIEPVSAYELFTSSAALLMEAFGELGYAEQRQNIYWITVKRLNRELSCNPQAEASINKNLNDLYQHGQKLDSSPYQSDFSVSRTHQHTLDAIH